VERGRGPGRATSIRIGCSGWNYRSWRGALYPRGLPTSRWLERYAERFDTVEVNATFYRLLRPEVAARWLEQTPDDFLFAVKGSRYLTHMRRLTAIDQGLRRFYEGLGPLADSPRLGAVLWQLPERFPRDDDRLAAAVERLPPGRHAWEFRHPSWFCEPVYDLLAAHGMALAYGDHPDRPFGELRTTADFAFLRFHHGHRGRRGNYSATELDAWARRIAELAREVDVLAYFNNDWEGFAVRNALDLRRRLDVGRPAERSASSGGGATRAPIARAGGR